MQYIKCIQTLELGFYYSWPTLRNRTNVISWDANTHGTLLSCLCSV